MNQGHADKISKESNTMVFPSIKDLTERKIKSRIKSRILKQNFVINRLKSPFCETCHEKKLFSCIESTNR